MKKLVTTTVVAAVAFGALSACNSDENSNAGGAPNNETATVLNAGGVAKHHAATDTEAKAPAEPNYTMSQEQAIESAKSYLDMDGESRAGLIDQLSSKMGEGFTLAQATYAANHVGL